MSLCPKCSDEVHDGVRCSQCRKYLHFPCSGLTENTYRKMSAEKRDTWRCVVCRNMAPQSAPNLADILKELREFRSVFEEMRSDFDTLKLTVENVSSQWKDMNTRIDTMESRLLKVEQSTSQLRKESYERDQFARMNNVEISGIPFHKSENLDNILTNIYTKVGMTLDITDINSIHRVRRYEQKHESPTRPPAIIVRYTRQRCKDQLLAAIKTRRGLSTVDIGLSGPPSNIFISDHLIPENKLLLKRARELKQQNNYAYLWVRDCKIFLRKTDTSKAIRISSNKDLDNIK